MIKEPIKKAKDGTYYFRANLGYHPVTGKQIQKYRSGFVSKKEAKEGYSKLILTSVDDLVEEEKKEITFKRYVDELFFPWYKSQVKESTFKNRHQSMCKHFKYFDKMLVNKITPIHVQSWQLKLSKIYGPNYVRNVQGMFSRAMDRAIGLGLAKENPSKIIGNIKKHKVKIEFWTLEEFQSIISLLKKEDYYEHYIFVSLWLLFMTGLRIGEASALQWKDIDFETGVLSVTKNLYYKSCNDYKFVEPKTKASVRQIVIDDDTLEQLRLWKIAQQKIIKTDFVLSYNGTPTNKHSLPRAIEKLSQMANIHRIKVHALRHSHASLLISMGENPLIIKERLGHEDIETTLGTYGHLYPNSNFEVARKLKGVINYQPVETVKNDNSHFGFHRKNKEINAITMQ